MTKKIVTCVISLCFLLTIFPRAVFATESLNKMTIVAAFVRRNAEEEKNIKKWREYITNHKQYYDKEKGGLKSMLELFDSQPYRLKKVVYNKVKEYIEDLEKDGLILHDKEKSTATGLRPLA